MDPDRPMLTLANDGILVIRRYGLAVVVLVAIAAAAAFALSSASAKVYTAEAQLVVVAGLGLDPTGGDILTAPRIAQTYGTMARTRPVLSEVIAQLDLPYTTEELERRLRVATDPSSPFVTIAATDESAIRAELTANALADILVDRSTVATPAGEPETTILEIVERAEVPLEPSGPRVLFNTALAAAVAFVLALTALSVMAYLRGEREAPQTSSE